MGKAKLIGSGGGSSKPKGAKELYCISNSTETIPANSFVKTRDSTSYNDDNSKVTPNFSVSYITGQSFPINGTKYSVCVHAKPNGSYINNIQLVLYSQDDGVVTQHNAVDITSLFSPVVSTYSQTAFKYNFIPINEYMFAMITGRNSGYTTLSVFQAEFDTLTLLTYTNVSSSQMYPTGLCGVASKPIQGMYIDIFTIHGGVSSKICTYTVHRFNSSTNTLTQLKSITSINSITHEIAYNSGELLPLEIFNTTSGGNTYKFYLFCCSSYSSNTKTVFALVRLVYEYNGMLNTNSGINVYNSGEYDVTMCDSSQYIGGLQHTCYMSSDSSSENIMCISNYYKYLNLVTISKPIDYSNIKNFVSVNNSNTAFSLTGMYDIPGNINTNMNILWNMNPCVDKYNNTIQVFGCSHTQTHSTSLGSGTSYCLMSAIIWWDTESDSLKYDASTYYIPVIRYYNFSYYGYGLKGIAFSDRQFIQVSTYDGTQNPSKMYLIPALRIVIDSDGTNVIGISKQSMNKDDIKVVYIPE